MGFISRGSSKVPLESSSCWTLSALKLNIHYPELEANLKLNPSTPKLNVKEVGKKTLSIQKLISIWAYAYKYFSGQAITIFLYESNDQILPTPIILGLVIYIVEHSQSQSSVNLLYTSRIFYSFRKNLLQNGLYFLILFQCQ